MYTGYGLNNREVGVRVCVGSGISASLASYTIGIGSYFLVGKAVEVLS
jgi:hypothetical protein